MFQSIQPAILNQNFNPPKPTGIPNIHKSFVAEGSTASYPKRVRPTRSILGKATDWKLLIDYYHKPYLFPPHIFATLERPDILIYSNSSRVAIFGELTCPAEEGITEAKIRKTSRYIDLAEKLRSLKHPWTTHILTLEVGARGFVARSTYNYLRKIGLTCHSAKMACRQASEVAARCTYAIYLRHKEEDWNSSRVLLLPNNCKDPLTEIHPSLRG